MLKRVVAFNIFHHQRMQKSEVVLSSVNIESFIASRPAENPVVAYSQVRLKVSRHFANFSLKVIVFSLVVVYLPLRL